MSKKKQVAEYQGEALTVEVEAIDLSARLSTVIPNQLSNSLFSCYLTQELLGRSLSSGQLVTISIYGRPQTFKLSLPLASLIENLQISESKPFIITKATKFELKFQSKVLNAEQLALEPKPAAKLAGLEAQINLIKELVSMTLTAPNIYTELKILPPRGILIHGPSGTGKTLLCKTLAPELCSNFLTLSSALISKFVGETENNIHNIFTQAKETAPAIIFIDEIDSLCPSRESSAEEYLKRIVSTFLSELDSLDENSRVIILATTNKPNNIDSGLRRPGRLDKEIEIPVPTRVARYEILKQLADNPKYVIDEIILQEVAEKTHGFVGADLAALYRESAMKAIKRSEGPLAFTGNDFFSTINEMAPSAMKDLIIEVPKVLWNDIGGYEQVKLQIRQAVEWPLKHPEAFKRLAIKPPKGILLYGPPGCSKTMMAKAVATESQLNFIAIKGPELFSKFVGDTEKSIREIFRKARTCAPSFIFIDEIDAIGSQRTGNDSNVGERVLCTLLNEMDGIETLSDVTVLAATNRPDIIDKALVRPGRIDRLIYIPPPDLKARVDVLKIATRGMPLEDKVDLEAVAAMMDKFSGAEVTLVPREAAILAITEDIEAQLVTADHFFRVLRNVRPRISEEVLRGFENFKIGN